MTHRTSRRGRAWWLAGLVVLFGGATGPASMQGRLPPGRLSGVIVDADSGAALPAVQVVVTSSPSRGAPLRAVTDAAGRYVVAPLAAGSYVVTASTTGYVEATFGRRHQIDTGGTIDLGGGQDRSRVDFQLTREAVLVGRVAGPEGRTLANLVVNVSRPHVADGQRRLASFASARSDAKGEYRVGGLLPGDYYVSVSLFETGDSRMATYAPTYYPGSVDIAAATRVRLDAGKVTRIGTVTPLPVPWAHLSGRLKSFDGKQLMRGALVMQPGDPDGLSYSPDAVNKMFPDGRFTYDFVVPGRYIIRALANTGTDQPDLFASWALSVEGREIAEQTMTLKPGSDLSGDARFDTHGTRPPADLKLIRIHTPLLDATGFGIESETRLRPDATFQLTSVDAGRMQVRVDGLPEPWSLARVTQGGHDITDDPLDIVQGQKLRDLQIVFTDVVTGLTGMVRNHEGAPLANYMVVAFPLNRALWRPLSRYIGATRTDWDGRYRLVSLPPGEYRVAAGNDFEEGEIHERDALDQLSRRAVPAVLVSGVLRTQDLVMTIGQRSGGG